MTLVIAHRGASAYKPENSPAAFREAIRQAADAIELDVHTASDGGIVVHHDDTIDGRAIASMTTTEACAHRLGDGQAVPTLPEALTVIGRDTIVFIEVKRLIPDHDEHLLTAIDNAPNPEHCHVHSFDHRIIHRLRRKRPSLVGGILSASYPIRPGVQLHDAGATELWQADTHTDRDLVDAIHTARGRLYVWTVDDAERMRTLCDWGVDGICTNTPDVARSVVG